MGHEVLTPNKKLIVTCQVSHKFPGGWRKWKVYHERVYMKKYVDIFIWNKLAMFLPVDINLFKVIPNKLEHCTDFFIPNIESGMEMKEASILTVLKQWACIT